MIDVIISGLIENAAFLFALSFVYEISYIIKIKNATFRKILNGVLIGLIGVAIMSVPYKFESGVIFDTRSILITVTAVVFGGIPTIITMLITAIYRIIIGGQGTIVGVIVILSCGIISIFFNNMLLKNKPKLRILKLYVLGLTTHMVMIACMLLFDPPLFEKIINVIAPPVIIIYPIATVLLGLLLIHQKERNESMLRAIEAEERYKSLFENSLAVMLILDPDKGQIIDANSAACRFYGWDLKTLRNMNITDINTLSWDDIKLEMSNSIAEKRNYFLFKHKRFNQPTVDVEVYSGPISFKGKTFLYSIVHDISSRSEALKSLKESENRFRMLVENAPDSIHIQIDGKFAFINNATLRLFNAKSEDEIIGKNIIDIIHPDYKENVSKKINELNASKDDKSILLMEEVYIKLDGSPVNVEVVAVPINYEGKDGALVFVRDITNRKKLERSKLEIEAQLRQQQKLEAIGTLAGGVAHEINNPINGIMNYAQLISDNSDENSNVNTYANEIICETDRISNIVKSLLQFSRQEKQAHSYARIEDIINQTISLIRTIFKKDQIDLIINMADDLPPIKCRSQQIQQVLMNLIINSKDALNEKYPGFDKNKIILLDCTHYVSENRKWILITVEDFGSGIATEIAEKIYEPFFSTKPKDIGTGLGLSISIGIIKDHHGTLTFKSKEGEYTKFYLNLPADNGWTL